MRTTIIVIFLFIYVYTNDFSQTGSIVGYISFADIRSSLYAAEINISEDKIDNSDQCGRFVIAGVHPGQYEMTISHIGYRTEIISVEVKANLLSTVHVDLKRTSLDLSEVKVNGKRNSTLNTISAVDIQLRPV